MALLWRRAASLSEGLVTEDGRRFRVVYPGRLSSRAGPDFRDSVIAAEGGEMIKGDVELHLEAPDWRGHRHHTDPNYNGVILHVVVRPKGKVASRQASGVQAPVVSIEAALPLLEGADGSPISNLTPFEDIDPERLAKVLDEAGDRRFLAKSTGFAMELAETDAEQVLYRALMEALGYSTNRKPFRELAERVPIAALQKLRGEPASTRLLALKAMMMRAAGLLRFAEPHGEEELMRRLLRLLPPGPGPMPASRWQLFRIRPANHPARRVAGAARIVDRYMDSGLVTGLAGLVGRQATGPLIVGLMARPLIGRDRAIELAVNVVLPFVHAWAGVRGDRLLMGQCVDLYHAVPRPADNEITREMKRLLSLKEGGALVKGARRHQGLIHLYRNLIEGRS